MNVSFATPATRKWRERGLCKDYDPELFFPMGVNEPAKEQTKIAKEICAECPVRIECLSYALESNEQDGVWGGLDRLQRKHIRNRMFKEAKAGRQFNSIQELLAIS